MSGPRFTAALAPSVKYPGGERLADDAPRCSSCDESTVIDEATKLCRPCWRAWRWSPIGYLITGARDDLAAARAARTPPILKDESGPGGASLTIDIEPPPRKGR